jgi:hypothetical protein
LSLGLLTSLGLAGAAYASECKDDPRVVGECFKVHGRFYGTASTRRRLSPVGRDPLRGRDFSVQYSPYNSPPTRMWSWIPEVLQRYVDDPDFYIRLELYGDFEVCRLAPDKPGFMGFICIQSAKNLIVRREPPSP